MKQYNSTVCNSLLCMMLRAGLSYFKTFEICLVATDCKETTILLKWSFICVAQISTKVNVEIKQVVTPVY